MDVIKKLLQDTPQQHIQAYQSYLKTHLKLLITTIDKTKIQDTSKVLMRKNNCILRCYKSDLRKLKNDSSDSPQFLGDVIEDIRGCKEKCGEELKKVKRYLSDVNFYSERNLVNCTKKCVGDERKTEYNECIWHCYNKLDKRYKRYWQQQLDKAKK